jgi:hypothetical protein
MILDPQNWDTMPEPLISTDIFEKRDIFSQAVPEVTSSRYEAPAMPWEL